MVIMYLVPTLYLTLTSVVFESYLFSWWIVVILDLTLTSVVFELEANEELSKR